MIFAEGERRRIVDDLHFGRYSGVTPDFIVMEQAFQENVDGLRTHSPADYQYDEDLLANSFQLVYDRTYYRIYRRNRP
jgi:hypothetical protein